MEKYTSVISIDYFKSSNVERKLRVIHIQKDRYFLGFKLKPVIETLYENNNDCLGIICSGSRHSFWIREDGMTFNCQTNVLFNRLIYVYQVQDLILNPK